VPSAQARPDCIDVNAGIFIGEEPEYLKWLVETVQQVTDKPCAIDSPDPHAIEAALLKNNVSVENIFVDPLVQPVSVDNTFGVEFINTIEKIVQTFPGIHTACGLSNISYGLSA